MRQGLIPDRFRYCYRDDLLIIFAMWRSVNDEMVTHSKDSVEKFSRSDCRVIFSTSTKSSGWEIAASLIRLKLKRRRA